MRHARINRHQNIEVARRNPDQRRVAHPFPTKRKDVNDLEAFEKGPEALIETVIEEDALQAACAYRDSSNSSDPRRTASTISGVTFGKPA